MLGTMKRLRLTEAEKDSLEQRHSTCNDGKARDRIKAVLLRSEGWSVPHISQALRRHESTIIRHLDDYRSGKFNNDSGGSESRLNTAQTEELVAHLIEHTYSFNYEIVAHIKEKYSVEFTVAGLHKWLKRNDFSYKKPKGHPHKADKIKQAQFIEEYNKLKTSVGSSEPIMFMDSVHPSQATKLTHGWIKTGTDKHVKTSASRTRLNIVGGIQLNHLDKAITVQYDTVNSDSIVDFMQRVRSSYTDSKTIHLILDGAGYHKAKTVSQEAEKLDIELHFLPPYSPNLNPIERLWKVMNEKVRNNKFFNNPTEFKQSIESFFKTILPDIAQDLNSRINDNFQTLKPAF